MNRTKIVILGSGVVAKEFILRNLDNEYSKIVGVIQDDSVDEVYNNAQYSILKDTYPDISLYSFEDLSQLEVDCIFSLEYRKIIPEKVC